MLRQTFCANLQGCRRSNSEKKQVSSKNRKRDPLWSCKFAVLTLYLYLPCKPPKRNTKKPNTQRPSIISSKFTHPPGPDLTAIGPTKDWWSAGGHPRQWEGDGRADPHVAELMGLPRPELRWWGWKHCCLLDTSLHITSYSIYNIYIYYIHIFSDVV